MAQQAIVFHTAPLESIVITFHEGEVSEDPETLDTTSIEFLSSLPVGMWKELDALSKRIILAQAITTKALFVCISSRKAEVTS